MGPLAWLSLRPSELVQQSHMDNPHTLLARGGEMPHEDTRVIDIAVADGADYHRLVRGMIGLTDPHALAVPLGGRVDQRAALSEIE